MAIFNIGPLKKIIKKLPFVTLIHEIILSTFPLWTHLIDSSSNFAKETLLSVQFCFEGN